jgi:S-adenosylmethionine:tRNA ribosyltransferase-isomerase
VNIFDVISYNYKFDESLIAKEPIYPKEKGKLLIYKKETGEIIHSNFGRILEFIPEEYNFIFNNTKVIKARLFGKKQTGGKVEVLINRPLQNDYISVFIRGKVRVGTKIFFQNNLVLEVKELISDGSRIAVFKQNGENINFSKLIEIIEDIGEIPIPPYLNRKVQNSDEKDYQTIFAKELGSVASPTASLHFSEKMFDEVKNKYNYSFLTLQIGAGTFKPVETKDIRDHILHKEFFSIPEETYQIINSKKPIIAIGTTVTRTIEYAFQQQKKTGEADIFLHPANKPKRVNALLTNFHLPKSSLLMLVASFIGIEEIQRVYKIAVQERYRFYSYGDSMLII